MVQALRARSVAVLPVRAVQAPLAALHAGAVDLVLVCGDIDFHGDESVDVVAVLRRDEPRDVLIPAREGPVGLATLERSSRVGAAGARRRSFLLAHRPDLTLVAPGNGQGPAEALRSGAVDALVLGAAEARRLSLSHLATEAFDPREWVPGVGQGSLVLLGRHDLSVPEGVASLDHTESRLALLAERACLEALGCKKTAPLGVLAAPHGQWIRIWGMVASPDGRRVVRGDLTGEWGEPEAVGARLAEILLARGAADLLAEADAA